MYLLISFIISETIELLTEQTDCGFLLADNGGGFIVQIQ